MITTIQVSQKLAKELFLVAKTKNLTRSEYIQKLLNSDPTASKLLEVVRNE